MIVELVKFHRGFQRRDDLMLDMGQIWWQSWLPSYNLQTKPRKLIFNVLWLSNRSSWFWSLLKWQVAQSETSSTVKRSGSSWEGRNGREGWGWAKWWFACEESGAMEGLPGFHSKMKQFHLRLMQLRLRFTQWSFWKHRPLLTWKWFLEFHINLKLQPRVVWRWSPLSQLGYLRSRAYWNGADWKLCW